MGGKTKFIRLIINRQEQELSVNSIIYAQVIDKLCTIYLTQQEPLRLFMPLSALYDLLPSGDFLQISRSCLISVRHIKEVTSKNIFMTDGTVLNFSQTKKKQILDAVQQFQSHKRQLERITMRTSVEQNFVCFDSAPIPFCVLEVIPNGLNLSDNFVFRYANKAIAALKQISRYRLMDVSLFNFFPNVDKKMQNTISKIAFQGGVSGMYRKNLVSGKLLHLTYFQPCYGYCACFLVDSADEDVVFQKKPKSKTSSPRHSTPPHAF